MYVYKLPEHYNKAPSLSRERKQYELRKETEENNKLTGFNNPVVEDTDYRTPVAKKEYLKMLDKMESTTQDKEARKQIHKEYINNKKYGSDDGTK
jgi:membrane-bound lytic murein transglycosylase